MLPLTDEQRLVRDTVRTFAREELWPKAPEYDASGAFPWPELKKLAELGLLGMTTPEAYGGAGMDAVSWALALEEIAYADPSVAVIVSVTSGLPQYMLLRFGTEAQKKRFLVPLAKGEWLGAFALTEPQAGSDPASLKTRAERVKGGWVLSGTKSWITSAGQAHLYVVMARTGEGRTDITAFLVEKGTPGLSFGPPEAKMGLHAAHTAEVRLEEVFVPDEQVLGQVNKGLSHALAGLDSGRIGIAAQALGIARAAFDIARDYADERVQFGKKLREFEGVAFKLANLDTRIAAASLLVWAAARKKDEGGRFTQEASRAKLFASELAVDATREAIQILGANGYHRDYRLERYYRDAKVTEIYEGTSEIQRLILARSLYR